MGAEGCFLVAALGSKAISEADAKTWGAETWGAQLSSRRGDVGFMWVPYPHFWNGVMVTPRGAPLALYAPARRVSVA